MKLRNQVDHGDFASPEELDTGAAKRMVDGDRDFALRCRRAKAWLTLGCNRRRPASAAASGGVRGPATL